MSSPYPNQMCIPCGNVSTGEYMANLHHAITEAMKLAFTGRELDLREGQTEAFYFLADFLQKLVRKE